MKATKRLWLVCVGAAFAIAITVTIVVMMRSRPRAASRDEIVNAAIAALAAGDVDKLVALSDSSNLDRLLDCSNTAAAEITAEQLERGFRQATESLAGKVSGRKLHVLAIENRDLARDDVERGADPHVFRTGDKVLGPCRARTTFRGEEVMVIVEETRSGRRPQKKAVTLGLYEVDGAWYLVDPPRGHAENDLPALGEDPDDLEADTYKRMRELADAMCRCADRTCGGRVSEEMTAWKADRMKREGIILDPKLTAKVEPLTKQFSDCFANLKE